MALFVLGVLLVVLKLAGFPGFGGLSWWWLALPFVLALLWWRLADSLGITQADAARRLQDKARKRRHDQMVNLGLRTGNRDER